MRIVLMCPKCGLVRTQEDSDSSCNICEYCGTNAIQVDFDAEEFNTVPANETEMIRQKIYRKFLYNNTEYDEATFEKRLSDEKKEHDKFQERLATDRLAWKTPLCPYCKSPYVEKITTGCRLISTALFGLGSSKVGKQWHCNQCKSNF